MTRLSRPDSPRHVKTKTGRSRSSSPFALLTDWFLVNQVLTRLSRTSQTQTVSIDGRVIQEKSQITFGRTGSQRTSAESADVCERMAVLECRLRDHIAN